MEKERISRLLFRFAAPALIGMLANALYNIVDRIFVGQVVGAHGIAAIALSFPCMLLFFAMSLLVGTGAASRISILLGEKRHDDAERALGSALMMALCITVVMMIFGRIFFTDILRLSGASENLYPLAAEYLSIIMYGVGFSIISFSMSYQIRASGSPSYAIGSQVIGALTNIILDAWFVLGLDMGVRGAAIATVISQFFSMLWALGYFWLPSASLRIRLKYVVNFDKKVISKILSVGTPACLVNLNFVMVHGMITYTSNKYGGDLAVSATGIMMSLDSLLFMPAIAIAEACQPIIGYNFGAAKLDRVIKTVKYGIMACTAFYVSSFILLMTNAELMVMMFNSTDRALIELSAKAIRLANTGIPVMGVTIVTTALLQGLGRGREGLIIAAIRFSVLLWVPLLILPRYFGAFGAWGSFVVSDICGSMVSAAFLMYTIKRLETGVILPPLQIEKYTADPL